MNKAYRPDIDGLRALAVIPVVLFHAGVPGITGGYVGVDIFFVISGFLLTGIIASQIDDRNFTIVTFYERRIRRIFPALCVMLAVVVAASSVYVLPRDFREVGNTALGALFSYSNFIFYKDAGYFDDTAIVKPFLHTWSLAVEEQFYLLLPPLLLAASRIPRLRVSIIACVAAASLAAALIVTPQNQDFAFYLLPARAWELLAGSLLALGAVPALQSMTLRQALAGLGLCLIAAPVFLFSAETPFPGPGAVLPVLGAALLIHCAPGTLVGSVMSIALLRGIGLISYSLYLWHWPVIVFISYYTQAPLTLSEAMVAILISVILSIVSWRFVEQPFRRSRRVGRRQLWTTAIAASAALGSVAAAVMLLDGLPSRFGPEVAHFYRENNVSAVTSRCKALNAFETSARSEACLIGEPSAPPTIAVWGDSHAAPLASALYESGPPGQAPLLRLSKGGCPPSLAEVIRRKEGCVAYNRNVVQYLAAHPEIDRIVVAVSFQSARYAADPGFGAGYSAAVAALLKMGKQVVLVGPIPHQPFDVARKLSINTLFGIAPPQGVATSEFLSAVQPALALMAAAAGDKAAIVMPHAVLCDEHSCAIVKDGDTLYVDDNHLSRLGARIVAANVRPLLDQAERVSAK